MNKILIFGVGLIGGSIALKAKDLRLCKEIVGISRSNGTDLSPFVKSGMLDRASSNYQSEIQSADLIVLATPVAQIEITLEKINLFFFSIKLKKIANKRKKNGIKYML